ncbi:MAG: hypothetical protein ACM34K_03295 [Bacillota bacterium]
MKIKPDAKCNQVKNFRYKNPMRGFLGQAVYTTACINHIDRKMQKINFKNIPATVKKNITQQIDSLERGDVPDEIKPKETFRDTIEDNLQYLKEAYQDKVLFEIENVANILGQSYESVCKRIRKGLIESKSIGRRRMIHRGELARIMTEGF